MSFIGSIKKALGFPDEFDDDELDDPDEKYIPAGSETPAGTEAPTDSVVSAVDTAVEVQSADSVLPGEIFDAVIEQFNAIQPDFVRQCLSTESQRKYLTDRIGASLRARLEAETEAARRRGEKLWEAEKQKMAGDLDKLKSEYHNLRQQREEFQSAQLSAARQKRALSERIHDLESQVNTLEAEKEQFQLENRSMLNKLRAAGVRNASGGSDAELNRISQENSALTDKVKSISDALDAEREKVRSLTAQVSELQTRLEHEADSMSSEQQAALAEIETQIKQFETVRKNKDAKISRLKAELSSRKAASDSEIADLKAEIARLNAVIQQLSDNKPAQEEANPKSATVKISAIDELMDSTDWFTTPEPQPMKKDPEVEELFGYKEPVKKTTRHDDQQLSLF